MLSVQLIGQPVFVSHEQSLDKLNTHYFEALIGGILLDRSRKLSRDELGFRFWPAHDELARRRNLRQLLYRLKQCWPESGQYFLATGDYVCWRGDAVCWVDLERVEYLLRLPPSYESLDELWTLNRGVLMAGHQERWITSRRREFNLSVQRYFRLALSWADALSEGELVVRCLESLVQLAPERDESWAELAAGYVRHGAFDRLEEASFRYTQAAKALGRSPTAEVLDMFNASPPSATPAASPGIVEKSRVTECELLLRWWSRARQGHSSFAMIEGSIGMGKTWLAQTIQASVQDQHGLVLLHPCYRGLSTAPYAVLASILRELAPSVLPSDWNRSSLGFLLKESAEEEPRSIGPLFAGIDRLALLRRIQAGLLPKLPLLLILDDVQWCDRASLEMLSALMLDRSDTRMMMLVTLNSMMVESLDPGLRRLLADLLQHRGGGSLTLEPLTAAGVSALVHDATGRSVSAEQLSLVLNRSEGIPQVAVELMWEIYQRGAPPQPQVLFRKQVQRALEGVSRDTRELAQLAAVLGSRFYFEALVRLARPGLPVDSGLEELLALQIIREHSDGRLEWTYEEVRAAVYDSVRTYQRVLIEQRLPPQREVSKW